MSNKKNSLPIHSLVAGMGPAGLCAALGLVIRGHDVTLIDKRSEYSRIQKVLIPQNLIHEFLSIGIESDFLKKLALKNGVTSLRKFQQFLLSALEQIIKDGFLNYKGSRIPIKGKLTILQGDSYEITHINANKQIAHLKNKQKIAFNHIIDATGTKRHIAHLIAKQSKGKYQIAVTSDLPQPFHAANAIICFNAVNTRTRSVSPEIAKTNYIMNFFHRLGWEEAYQPLYYIRSKALKKQVYVLTEIPEQLVGTCDYKDILYFILPILRVECGVLPGDMPLDEREVKLLSTFRIQHDMAESPFVTLGKGGCAILVGDARMTPNFHFANGIEKAVLDGLNLTAAFDGQGKLIPSVLLARTQKLKEQIITSLQKQARTIGVVNFNRLNFMAKLRLIFNETKNKETFNFASKSLLVALLCSLVSLPLSIIAGCVVFAYMKYIAMRSSLTYSIAQSRSPVAQKAFEDGFHSESSWKNYILSFTRKRNYQHYHEFVEGRYYAQSKSKLLSHNALSKFSRANLARK